MEAVSRIAYVCLLFLPVSLEDTTIYGSLFGSGVCSLLSKDTKIVKVTMMNLANESDWEFCWNWPPWCTVYLRTVYYFEKAPQKIPHDRLKLTCCDGWKVNSDKRRCLPTCSPNCLPGFCVNLNNCSRCESEFTGINCEKTSSLPVPEHIAICDCPNDNYACDHNGACICAPGLGGPNCTDILEPTEFIVDPVPLCSYYILRVVMLLFLLAVSLIFIVFFIRRKFDMASFKSLDLESIAEPGPSTSIA